MDISAEPAGLTTEHWEAYQASIGGAEQQAEPAIRRLCDKRPQGPASMHARSGHVGRLPSGASRLSKEPTITGQIVCYRTDRKKGLTKHPKTSYDASYNGQSPRESFSLNSGQDRRVGGTSSNKAGFGGRPKTSGQGRPKGSRNKITVDVAARLAALRCDPVSGMARIATQLSCVVECSQLAQYVRGIELLALP
jgi:hypothetical protein